MLMMGILSIRRHLFAARMNSGQPATKNVNLEFDAITAVTLGGVILRRRCRQHGRHDPSEVSSWSSPSNTGLTMVSVPSFWRYCRKGGLLLFALTTDYIRNRSERKTFAASMKNL